jgi:hypothetical protein
VAFCSASAALCLSNSKRHAKLIGTGTQTLSPCFDLQFIKHRPASDQSEHNPGAANNHRALPFCIVLAGIAKPGAGRLALSSSAVIPEV